MKQLDDFKDPKTNESIPKVDTTWVTRSQEMHENSWTRFSKDCLYKALSAYGESPSGRVHCVFLVLSNDNLQEMADIVDSSFSIIGSDANKHISIISERKELGTQMIKYLKDDIRRDVKPPCSIFGIPFDLLRNILKALLGSVEFGEPDATTELPYLDGSLRPVPSKRINSLTDLEVYIPYPDLSCELDDINKAKENFYMGNAINQMNLFHNDAIERTLEKKLLYHIDECLQELSTLEVVELCTETVTLRYESGSGATTLGRQILWKKKEEYRCAVVKKISEKTEYQISQLQNFLYETTETSPIHIPPVLIFVDNFPEQPVHHLSDRLSKNKTKCVLLSTIPLDKSTKEHHDDLTLGKLNNTEISRVRGVLSSLKNERAKEAAKVLDREKRFMWLGLELFGRKYAVIESRLSTHIYQVLSQIPDQFKDAYEMILNFCSLLNYYSKRRSIYPQPCVEEIMYYLGGQNLEENRKIEKIHDKFGGLLLEDINEAVGYYGWRPAHALVGEVVLKEIDLFSTAKKLVDNIKNRKQGTYVWNFLTDDIVTVFLQREKISENPSDNESDGSEDEFLDMLEVRTKYSQLILDINKGGHVQEALDLLITLNEKVTITQHKAHTFQQIARMFAYEIGMKVSDVIRALTERVNKIIHRNDNPINQTENGFDIAHKVIDEAINLQQSYPHHLVTKATFYRSKLKHLHDNIGRINGTEELKVVIEEAINTTKKGIDVYENALKDRNRDSYLHAMIGKIQTIVVLVELFKKLPFFAQHKDGQDESFKNYVTFKKHPDELRNVVTVENMDYFFSLIVTAVQLSNDFLGEIQIRRKLSYKAHEIKELENAKIRAMKLRSKFYDVTKLDRTNIKQEVILKEDIVYDILYKNDESPFSSWVRLSPENIGKIYALLKDAIPTETKSHNAMLTCARAALQQNVEVDTLSKLVDMWCKKYPDSEWAHMFRYMIHFPVPNGSLKTDTTAVKSSVVVCRKRLQGSYPGHRRSGAEYLLGKGIGLKSIIPPHQVVMQDAVEHRSRDVKLETEFWRSKIVYDKLERLSGKKNLQKKGVLNCRGTEIPFDNDRYPHESRDELWFCVGFNITGPYAYDPIDKDTYKQIQEKFKNANVKALPQKSGSFKGPSHAWQFGDSHRKSASSSKTKAASKYQKATPNPEDNDRSGPHGMAAPGKEAFPQKNENDKTAEESQMAGAASSSRYLRQNSNMTGKAWMARTKNSLKDCHPTQIEPHHKWQLVESHRKSASSSRIEPALKNQNQTVTPNLGNSGQTGLHGTVAPGKPAFPQMNENDEIAEESEETWKKNPKLIRTLKIKEDLVNFYPTHIDSETRKVQHGAQVRGAPKSVECYRHKFKTFPKSCTFAHTWGKDPIVQTICDHCTKSGLSFCNEREHKERYHYNLGPFLIAK